MRGVLGVWVGEGVHSAILYGEAIRSYGGARANAALSGRKCSWVASVEEEEEEEQLES